ncbi:MAG: SDR family oxidoreductase, partial [Sulfuritalea sp.]|nr:SDR family oxidoreductase [Sulfuritalea sp.]
MGFLAGKKILITGLLSNRSIAYGIAAAMKREGAELAFTYQMEKHQDRVAKLAADFDSNLVFHCDVADDHLIEALFPEIAKHWDGIDSIV